MKRPSVWVRLTVFSAVARAQQLQFEVASIKPASPNNPQVMGRIMPGGTFAMRGATLKMLIAEAYYVWDFQVSGGPAWIGTEKYDITPKTGDSASGSPGDPSELIAEQRQSSRDQLRLRLQTLLADRFRLKLHRETKELPVYALVVAKSGPRLTENDAGDGRPKGMISTSPAGFSGHQLSTSTLAEVLSLRLARPVLDETGLKGNYDFELNFAPDQPSPGAFAGPGPGPSPEPLASDPNGPTIFTALEEQLGLKLESKKGPVEIILVDHAEKASEN
jgi:bla regulator protein blaR1